MLSMMRKSVEVKVGRSQKTKNKENRGRPRTFVNFAENRGNMQYASLA